MQANGVQMPPVNLHLSPQQAVVVSALERLANTISIEAQQMDQLWGNKEEAAKLLGHAKAIIAQRDAYMQSLSKLVTATQMPIIQGVSGRG